MHDYLIPLAVVAPPLIEAVILLASAGVSLWARDEKRRAAARAILRALRGHHDDRP